jgi:hypothetical protein
MKLTKIDEDALRRAVDQARREPMKAEQLDGIEKQSGRIEAQMTSAYHCQVRNLKLKPWESPPMHGDVVNARSGDGRDKARELLDRLLAANLSRFEPNPLQALQAIEARAHGDLPPAA